MDKKSVIDMGHGVLAERVDYEMSKVIDNILDPNTPATKRRSMTVTLEFLPDLDRKTIGVKTTVKNKLEATNPITMTLCIIGDENGEPVIVELSPQIPGQQNIGGGEQDEPARLRLIRGA